MGCDNTNDPIIERSAFENCTSITDIRLPNSLEKIRGGAFSNCTGLTSIVIPISVAYVDQHAFKGLSNLTIYCEAESQPSDWNSYWNSAGSEVIWGYEEN